jgi:hypothetical protein
MRVKSGWVLIKPGSQDALSNSVLEIPVKFIQRMFDERRPDL